MKPLSISNSLVLLWAILFSFSLVAQSNTYTEQSDAAWALYEESDYGACATAYDQLINDFPTDKGENLFIAACCATLDGQLDQAFDYLSESIATDYWKNTSLYYSDPDLDTLRSTIRWQEIKSKLEQKEIQYQQKLKAASAPFLAEKEVELLSYRDQKLDNWNNLPAKQLLDRIESANLFPPYQTIKTQHLSLWLPYHNGQSIPFLVQLPKGYDSQLSYPTLFHLHGAVRSIEAFPKWVDKDMAGGWNQYISKYADSLGVILVYPVANQAINWLTPTDGFDLVPRILAFLKLRLNIDDNRVFVSGHSNGATGAFTLAVLQPTAFAGAFGFNTHPQVYTGATPIQNLQNRPFHAIVTDQDYYYPTSGIDSLHQLVKSENIQFSSSLYKGFPHWFPAFEESEAAVAELFDRLEIWRRNPFKSSIYWACDDVRFGRCDWLSIEQLDTLQSAAHWYKELNFDVPNWVDVDDETQLIPDYSKPAFLFPKRVGAARAEWKGNRLYIETSRVKTLRIYLHPELLPTGTSNIKIYLNGKKYGRYKYATSSSELIETFKKNRDSAALWTQTIVVNVF